MNQYFKHPTTIALDMIRSQGGTLTINFCTDHVQKSIFQRLSRMADAGIVARTISDNHLVHTFALIEAAG